PPGDIDRRPKTDSERELLLDDIRLPIRGAWIEERLEILDSVTVIFDPEIMKIGRIGQYRDACRAGAAGVLQQLPDPDPLARENVAEPPHQGYKLLIKANRRLFHRLHNFYLLVWVAS